MQDQGSNDVAIEGFGDVGGVVEEGRKNIWRRSRAGVGMVAMTMEDD